MTLSDLISGGPTGQQGLGGIVNRFIAPTNALGQFGKALTQASGGAVGDALSLLDHQKRQGEQDAMQQQLQQAQLAAMTAKQNRGQFIQLGNGGVGFGDPDTGSLQTLREPEAPEQHKSALEQQIDILRQYQPDIKPADIATLVKRAIPGAAYDPAYLQQRNADQMALIGARTAGSLAVKRTPSASASGGGGGGGGGKTAATRVVGGKAYYKVNGAWYDNPEGK